MMSEIAGISALAFFSNLFVSLYPRHRRTRRSVEWGKMGEQEGEYVTDWAARRRRRSRTITIAADGGGENKRTMAACT